MPSSKKQSSSRVQSSKSSRKSQSSPARESSRQSQSSPAKESSPKPELHPVSRLDPSKKSNQPEESTPVQPKPGKEALAQEKEQEQLRSERIYVSSDPNLLPPAPKDENPRRPGQTDSTVAAA